MALEQKIEEQFIHTLTQGKYSQIKVNTQSELENNFKKKVEKLNNFTFQNDEFKNLLNKISKIKSANEAHAFLMDSVNIKRQNETTTRLILFDKTNLDNNSIEVSNQLSIANKKNRFDVHIHINGLPLIHIELKAPDTNVKRAFAQIIEYKQGGYIGGLLNMTQLYVISNETETKYFANDKSPELKQTFTWADKENNKIINLTEFANTFLKKENILKFIQDYLIEVGEKSSESLFALRSYQIHAIEAIVDRVKNPPITNQNGYVWHTTGSGKTLTSFLTCNAIQSIPSVDKTIFCVDRQDLNTQTLNQFNSFTDIDLEEDAGTKNTKALISKLLDTDTKFIITSIQKLNLACKNFKDKLKSLEHKRIVCMFDECHRSQFGEAQISINKTFVNLQMFGFTGTPIFSPNAKQGEKRTTQDVFHHGLHKYLISDAIADENVLPFQIDTIGEFKIKSQYDDDKKVININKKDAFSSPQRITDITKCIIKMHKQKTHNKKFNAMFCTGGIEDLIAYYDEFKKHNHDLNITAIYSAQGNDTYNVKHTNKIQKLESIVKEYNEFTSQSIELHDKAKFKKEIQRKVKAYGEENSIDILLVSDMLLTGYDAKCVNTLYVDKELTNHSLIQAFSRTNRTNGAIKTYGNIVCFRPSLHGNTEKAIKLYSDDSPLETAIALPYGKVLQLYKDAIAILIKNTPTALKANNLVDEKEKLQFAHDFKQVIQKKKLIETYFDYKKEDIHSDKIQQVEFEEEIDRFTGVYKKHYEEQKNKKEGVTQHIYYEMDLIDSITIDSSYIYNLMKGYEKLPDKSRVNDKLNELEIKNPEQKRKIELVKEYVEDINYINTPFRTFKTNHKQKSEKFIMSKLEKTQSLKWYLDVGSIPTEYFIEKTYSKRKIIKTNVENEIKKYKELY